MWKPVKAVRWEKGEQFEKEISLPEEHIVSINLNGCTAACLSCSGVSLDELALGFLFSRALIHSMREITEIKCDAEKGMVWVEVPGADINNDKEKLQFVGSGCSDVFSSEDKFLYVDSTEKLSYKQVADYMLELEKASNKDTRLKGVHTAVLFIKNRDPIVRREIGRHNAVDKLLGYCLKEALDFGNSALVLSGRLSADEVVKAALAKIPFLISRAGISVKAVELAEKANISLVGYARDGRFDVYASQHRIYY